MTYEEAMEQVNNGKKVTRKSNGISQDNFVFNSSEGLMMHIAPNNQTGLVVPLPFIPTDEDKAATDWENVQDEATDVNLPFIDTNDNAEDSNDDVVTEKEPLLAFGSDDFQRYVRERILEMCQNDGFDITLSDVYVVWYSKSLQNHKGLFATTLKDGLYYEATYNGDKRELYIDVYKKQANIAIQLFKKQ